jgi:hypothetical protein
MNPERYIKAYEYKTGSGVLLLAVWTKAGGVRLFAGKGLAMPYL